MWEVFFKYAEYVKEGRIKAIECPDCGYDLILRTKMDMYEPHLWCSVEDRYIRPGVDMRDKIKDLVNSATRA